MMKSTIVMILAILLSIIASAQEVMTGRVVKISDGDTFTLLVNEHDQVKVRLDGIDAPEKKQAFGNKSKEYLSDMIWGQEVTITVMKKDRYGRSVAKVSTQSIEDVNIEMIKAGMAWHYKEYNKDKSYAEAEESARAQKRGLWIDKEPIKPQDFRKMKR